jgi:hypothetical protein
VVVFVVSLAAGNASVYDPYWSVAPAVIVAAWTGLGGITARQATMLALVLIWAVRLTATWAPDRRSSTHRSWRARGSRHVRFGKRPIRGGYMSLLAARLCAPPLNRQTWTAPDLLASLEESVEATGH